MLRLLTCCILTFYLSSQVRGLKSFKNSKDSSLISMLLQFSSKDKSSCSPSSSTEQLRVLEGPRAKYNYVVTALRVFDCSIRVYRSFGAHKQSGAQGKMPQLPPFSAVLPGSSMSNVLRNAPLAIFIPGNLPIILELFFMLSYSNYSQNYSGIIDGSLLRVHIYNKCTLYR